MQPRVAYKKPFRQLQSARLVRKCDFQARSFDGPNSAHRQRQRRPSFKQRGAPCATKAGATAWPHSTQSSPTAIHELRGSTLLSCLVVVIVFLVSLVERSQRPGSWLATVWWRELSYSAALPATGRARYTARSRGFTAPAASGKHRAGRVASPETATPKSRASGSAWWNRYAAAGRGSDSSAGWDCRPFAQIIAVDRGFTAMLGKSLSHHQRRSVIARFVDETSELHLRRRPLSFRLCYSFRITHHSRGSGDEGRATRGSERLRGSAARNARMWNRVCRGPWAQVCPTGHARRARQPPSTHSRPPGPRRCSRQRATS